MSVQEEDHCDSELIEAIDDQEIDFITPLFNSNDVVVTEVTQPGTHWFFATFLVVNAALGAGILNFPRAFHEAGGISVAISVQGVLLVFVFLALVWLAYCADISKAETYQDVVRNCGSTLGHLCSVVIVIYCYGTCVTFLIIIGDQSDKAFSAIYGAEFCHRWYFHRAFTTTIASVFLILPMCFSRRIDFLKYPSSLGVLAILYLTFVVIYEYDSHKYKAGVIKTSPDDWMDVFLVVPTLCFGYQCHVSCVPIYSCVKGRSPSVFGRTAGLAMAICFGVYTLVGSYGYMTFGSFVEDDLQVSYDASDPVVMVGMLALAIKTVTTYPVLLFCGRMATVDLWAALKKPETSPGTYTERNRRIVLALAWFSTSLVAAILFPSLAMVIKVLGCLAALFIFVFPGICIMKTTLKNQQHSRTRKSNVAIATSVIFLCVGAFIFGLTVTQTISQQVNGAGSTWSKICT